jgi:hypothetical protein
MMLWSGLGFFRSLPIATQDARSAPDSLTICFYF